ncbi:MAG: hypothetical protein D6788_10605 [Planctomycetota bacterium]|nr:MAG: hypothetical protein D6788_10605 [Planctomycetota bacterium]
MRLDIQKHHPLLARWAHPRQPLVLAVLVAVGLAGRVTPAHAQTRKEVVEVYSPATTTDAYGNAQPIYRERRALSVYQNEVQKQILQSYQEYGRRPNRRGGLSPFSLTENFRRRRSLLEPWLTLPLAAPSRSQILQRLQQQERAMRLYGGFGKRAPLPPGTEIQRAIERRTALIAATALTAPIRRAGLGEGGRMATVGAVATGEPLSAASEVPPPARLPTLEARLASRVEALRAEAEKKAKEDFAAGRYRSAARYFETAQEFDPADVHPRMGELLCHLAMGSLQTAVRVFESLTKHVQNPFVMEADRLPRFSSTREAVRVRVVTQSLAGTPDAPAELLALDALVRWTLGDRREAAVVLDRIASAHPDTRYARWSALAEAALRGPSPSASPEP